MSHRVSKRELLSKRALPFFLCVALWILSVPIRAQKSTLVMTTHCGENHLRCLLLSYTAEFKVCDRFWLTHSSPYRAPSCVGRLGITNRASFTTAVERMPPPAEINDDETYLRKKKVSSYTDRFPLGSTPPAKRLSSSDGISIFIITVEVWHCVWKFRAQWSSTGITCLKLQPWSSFTSFTAVV